MRKIYLTLLLVTSSLSFAQRTVTISTDNVVQTMDGFGGSDAWRTQFVGKNWPEQKKNAIAHLLFSKEIEAQGKDVAERIATADTGRSATGFLRVITGLSAITGVPLRQAAKKNYGASSGRREPTRFLEKRYREPVDAV